MYKNIILHVYVHTCKYKITLSERTHGICSTVPPALPTKPPIPVPGIPPLAVVSIGLFFYTVGVHF